MDARRDEARIFGLASWKGDFFLFFFFLRVRRDFVICNRTVFQEYIIIDRVYIYIYKILDKRVLGRERKKGTRSSNEYQYQFASLLVHLLFSSREDLYPLRRRSYSVGE